MQVYSSAAGYPVQAGETYRITAVYENPPRTRSTPWQGFSCCIRETNFPLDVAGSESDLSKSTSDC